MPKNKKVLQLSKELSEAIIAEGRRGYELGREGNIEIAEAHFQHAWSMLPEPRHDWSDSSSLAAAILEFYLSANLIEKAIAWLPNLLRTRHFDYETHLDVLAGKA